LRTTAPDAETRIARHAPDDVRAEDSITLLGALSVVLRYRVMVVSIIALCVLAVGVVTVLLPRTYTTQAVFMPHARKAASPLAGLAAQFGLGAMMGMGEPGQSPAFYMDLLKSRRILEQLVQTPFEFTYGDRRFSGTLITFYELDDKPPAQALDQAVRKLRSNIAVARGDREAGTIRLAVSSRDPVLAKLMADRLLGLVDEFNTQQRRSQGNAERRFVEQRVAEVKAELLDAENRLQTFLLRNRVANSPELTFDRERLTREVSLRNQVYTALVQDYEPSPRRRPRGPIPASSRCG
jgi:uncharacterized protein involved in exopolysaccharide biosynthesis